MQKVVMRSNENEPIKLSCFRARPALLQVSDGTRFFLSDTLFLHCPGTKRERDGPKILPQENQSVQARLVTSVPVQSKRIQPNLNSRNLTLLVEEQLEIISLEYSVKSYGKRIEVAVELFHYIGNHLASHLVRTTEQIPHGILVP